MNSLNTAIYAFCFLFLLSFHYIYSLFLILLNVNFDFLDYEIFYFFIKLVSKLFNFVLQFLVIGSITIFIFRCFSKILVCLIMNNNKHFKQRLSWIIVKNYFLAIGLFFILYCFLFHFNNSNVAFYSFEIFICWNMGFLGSLKVKYDLNLEEKLDIVDYVHIKALFNSIILYMPVILIKSFI